MPTTLSNLGTGKIDAEEQTNVTGQMTPILSWSPIDGMVLEISNMGGVGFPFYFEPRDANGNLLPLDTETVYRYDAPRLDQPQVVSHSLENLRTYRTLDIQQQQNEEYRDRTRVELKGESVAARDIDTLEVAINSSAQIDWANSRAYVDKNAVTVGSEA